MLQVRDMDGFINLLKPPGPTSSRAVGKIKSITGAKKVGHTGTLDPGAAGVLPLCLGRATKLSQFLMESEKEYRSEITFGLITDTQDSYGSVLAENVVELSEVRLKELLKSFTGPLVQVPPMYSAVKQGGKKLYELARKGLEIERKPRNIEIYRLDLVEFIPPNRAIIDIKCSKGTYIRTLCHDIGVKSGYGAIMSFLVRLSAGGFVLKDAITIEELTIAAEKRCLRELILPIDYPLQHIEKVEIREDALGFALNGNSLYPHNFLSNIKGNSHDHLLRLYYGRTLIGLGVYAHNDQVPHVKIKCKLTGARTPWELNNEV